MNIPPKNILLTGGSGVLGNALLNRLPLENVICLVNKTPITRPKLRLKYGSIVKPRLGLTQLDYNDLASQVDCIIHAAAITDFSIKHDEVQQTNVEGTLNMLEFASKAKAPFYHISTAFLHPYNHGKKQFAPSAYESSKKESEIAIRNSALPASIIKPSIIVGNSLTGKIIRNQGIHLLIHLFMKGYLPVLPGMPRYYCDFVPQDFVADAILTIVNEGKINKEFWLTSGEQAMKMEDLISICSSQYQKIIGKPLDKIRILENDVFERLILPVFLPALPNSRRRMIEHALHFSRYLMDKPFKSSFTELSINLPSPEISLIRNIERWALKNGYELPFKPLLKVNLSPKLRYKNG